MEFHSAECAAYSVGPLDTLVGTLVNALLVAQCGISRSEYWPPDYASAALQPGGLDSFDYVVIGAGSAGSVVASRLSEDPNARVLVLEAGGDPPQESEVPALFFGIQHTNATWNYFTEPTGRTSLATRRQSCYWPRGKVIGGSGAINGMLYVRGNRKDYDGWLQQGNPGWGWDDVVPYFEKSLRPSRNSSSTQPYIRLSEAVRFNVDIEDMIFAGADEVGVPRVERFAEGSETGYSFLPGTVQNGQRMSTGKTFLGKVSDRANLRVIKNAEATHINFDATGRTVQSVSFVLDNSKELEVKVNKELVLSAGTIGSAKLLMLSGIGPKNHLESLDIPVRHDLPVGKNLQDHALVPIFYQLDTDTADPLKEQEVLDMIYSYLIHRRGPLASHVSLALTAFINSVENSTSPYPDIEHHYFIIRRGDFFSLNLFLRGIDIDEQYCKPFRDALKSSNMILVLNVLAHPKSIGKIELRSANYMDTPKIYPNYLNHPEDGHTLIRGIHHLMKLEQTKAFRARRARLLHIPIEECDQYAFKSDLYWRCYIKYFTFTLYHHTGTVKMGPRLSKRPSCVSPRLQLYGVDNLRVADASIMPNVTSCNTNAPTIMVGEKAADFIKEDQGAAEGERLPV